MNEQTPAVPKLVAFVKAHYPTVQDAARELRESPSAFSSWFTGASKPGGAKRSVIEAWTGGEVAVPDWLTKKDRARVRTARKIAARRAGVAAPADGEEQER